jgi:dCMP deaminase
MVKYSVIGVMGDIMKEPSWDHIWISLAYNISQKSKDPRLKVGAVIVTGDNETVLAIGYNGDEKGGNNKPDSLKPGESGFIHAEANALTKLNYWDHRPRKIYLTHSPCPVCARMIVNAGITKVVYANMYRNSRGLDILNERGIETKHMPRWE